VAGVAVLCAALSALARADSVTIEPRTRVNGMLVVQSSSRQSETSLFGGYCDPVVLTSGRRSRNCGTIPRWSRLYVGYGLFARPSSIERAWKATTWKLWLDGQPIDLTAFGTSDRVLPKYGPADGKDVVLREWSIVLVRPTPGAHRIRYRTADADGVMDTTWNFRVRAS
jgi:hypothetical protein